MNWTRGLLRLWIVTSLAWIIMLGTCAYIDLQDETSLQSILANECNLILMVDEGEWLPGIKTTVCDNFTYKQKKRAYEEAHPFGLSYEAAKPIPDRFTILSTVAS